MTTICFYNHWHNGDVFSGRGYIRHIMNQYPGFDYRFAVNTHPKVLADLRAPVMHVNQLPPEVTYQQQGLIMADHVFVNTWVGVYLHQVFPAGEHANWCSLNHMWRLIAEQLNKNLHININISNDPLMGVPDPDWSVYNTQAADHFVNKHEGKFLILCCNGDVRSRQSNWQSMQHVIEPLATQHADHLWICTQKFRTQHNNIMFTDDIFGLDNDINEIAYLSTKCDMIIGKNSGPYMFCHVSTNIQNPHKIFLSLSHRPTDSYAYGVQGVGCHYYHSLTEHHDVFQSQFEQVLQQSVNQPAPGVMIVLNA